MTKMLGFLEREDYDGLVEMILEVVHHLQLSGAEFAVMASNTPHIIFHRLKEKSPLPLISIIEATCAYAREKGYKKVIVLGTKFTMSNGLYTNVFPKYGVEAVVPDAAGIEAVHQIIFPKLEDGIVVAEDKVKMLAIAEELIQKEHAEALVLGCTELPMMIQEGDVSVPLLNTTTIHVESIVRRMVEN